MMRQNNNLSLINSRTTTGFVFLFGCMLMSASEPVEAADGSWMFRRSYFSHADNCCGEVEYPQPVSRSEYRPAYVGSTTNYSFRGGFRFNRINIRGAGSSYDTTIRHEGWGGFYGPPYGR